MAPPIRVRDGASLQDWIRTYLGIVLVRVVGSSNRGNGGTDLLEAGGGGGVRFERSGVCDKFKRRRKKQEMKVMVFDESGVFGERRAR